MSPSVPSPLLSALSRRELWLLGLLLLLIVLVELRHFLSTPSPSTLRHSSALLVPCVNATSSSNSISSIVTSTSSPPSTSTSGATPFPTTPPLPPPGARFSFDVEPEDRCHTWSNLALLFPNGEQRPTFERNGSVVSASWEGWIRHVMYFPLTSNCMKGSTKASILKSTILPEPTLCNYDAAYTPAPQTTTARSTVVVRFAEVYNAWDDLTRNHPHNGINLWHFHVEFVPIWLTLKRLEVTAALLRNNDTFNTYSKDPFPRINPIIDLVLVFPKGAFARFTNASSSTPVYYDASVPLATLTDQGCGLSTLAGLQAIHDGLHPTAKILVASYNTTVRELHKAFDFHQLNPRPAALFAPRAPNLFMWQLERFDIEGWIDNCKNSVLHQYSSKLLSSNPVTHPTRIASHVCFVSRQFRSRPNAPDQPVASRNLARTVFADIISRLSAPIVLSPHLSPRHPNATAVPRRLAHASLTGQMRFVNQHCAVLVGVHGAGLANLFGMRPGSHVIEFNAFFNYTIFKNSALLLNNVSYTRISFESEVVSESHHWEANFSLPEDKLDLAVDLINDELEKSIDRQEQLLQEGRPR